jgi:hypothetical protein
MKSPLSKRLVFLLLIVVLKLKGREKAERKLKLSCGRQCNPYRGTVLYA